MSKEGIEVMLILFPPQISQSREFCNQDTIVNPKVLLAEDPVLFEQQAIENEDFFQSRADLGSVGFRITKSCHDEMLHQGLTRMARM